MLRREGGLVSGQGTVGFVPEGALVMALPTLGTLPFFMPESPLSLSLQF